MISLKIYLTLKSFSDQDLKKFEKFASSKFSNGRDLSGLVRVFRSLTANISERTTNKEFISLISEKLKLKYSVVSNRLSDLNKLVEYFLLLKISDIEKVKKNFLLLEFHVKEKNFNPFDSLFFELEDMILKNKYDFLSLENLSRLYESAAVKAFQTNNYQKYLEFNEKKNDYRIANFISDFLRSTVEIHQQDFYNKKTGSNYSIFENKIEFTEFINRFKNRDVKAYYLMQILYYNYMSFTNQDKISFYKKAKKMHKQGYKYFNAELNNFLYFMNINYCIHKINLNQAEFYNEVFQIINAKLKDNLFFELRDPNHNANSFRSYINIGLRLNKYKWVNDFIEKYEKYLPAKNRNDDRNLNKGKLMVCKGEYIKAFEFLNSVKKTNFFYYTDCSFLKIRAFFSLGKFNEALEETARLKSYISYHNDIPDFYYKKIVNHSKDSFMLIKYKTDSISSEDLHFYFSERKFPLVQDWILDTVKSIQLKKNN